MRRAIVTLAIGDNVASLAGRTHPLMARYAERLAAEFVVIDTPRLAYRDGVPAWYSWEKYQLANLLKIYDQVVFFDTDILIRPDCPDLLAFCGDRFGAFNEVPYNLKVLDRLKRYCQLAGITLARIPKAYYNAGVMVLNRSHREVFVPPPILYSKAEFFFAEQTHTNVRLQLLNISCRDLPLCFNAMPAWIKLADLGATCPVIHFAGCRPEDRNDLVDQVLKFWRVDGFDV